MTKSRPLPLLPNYKNRTFIFSFAFSYLCCFIRSFGYYSINGRKLFGGGDGKPYGPAFTQGDVVGCGINFNRDEIFFTKNGKYLGSAFTHIPANLYPTVALHSQEEKVTVNFGANPFKFDIDSYIEVTTRPKKKKKNKHV